MGMNSRGAVNNEEVLTYRGVKDPCYEARRKTARCKACCTGMLHHYLEWRLADPFQVSESFRAYGQVSTRPATNIHLPRCSKVVLAPSLVAFPHGRTTFRALELLQEVGV
jgi:hypothetical protein